MLVHIVQLVICMGSHFHSLAVFTIVAVIIPLNFEHFAVSVIVCWLLTHNVIKQLLNCVVFHCCCCCCYCWTRRSSVGIVISLRSEQPGHFGSIAGICEKHFFRPKFSGRLCIWTYSLLVGTEPSSPGVKWPGAWNWHLYLALSSVML